MKIFVTGAAGFIGFHVAARLLSEGHEVLGYDALTEYYDPELKQARLGVLSKFSGFSFERGLLEDEGRLAKVYATFAPEQVFHFAAQAGVRYSIENPKSYMESNVGGTFSLLEAMRVRPPSHFMFASTSSVYGGNVEVPFCEDHRTDAPASLYAATKRAGEAMSHSYSSLYAIPTTCFRFFTVYGPWGRPDMALFKFVDGILNDRVIDIYGHGKMRRDFTYIDDLVEGIIRLSRSVPRPDGDARQVLGSSNIAPWRVVNIGNGNPIELLHFVQVIEETLGAVARKNFMEMQPGDVVQTYADVDRLEKLVGHIPFTSVREGVRKFVAWYGDYYGDGR
ncbi:NAD-dependent epimerase/dehydratase family protein [Demequina sp. NBRC 110055]|uniref:NAD-dependent epimerase/dehydratase family protein n=1 Tax=Demequina sp. NBRC 110055 TaxID=1570344 RepID=UPI0009FE820A|nr:NAD-dependent epimerase/dehydratase family protein [Demequina sp. NBRC 110055]